MTVLLPASVDMNFTLTPKITIGGNFLSFVKSYHLNDRFDGTNTLYWVKSTNEIFGYLQFAPSKSLLFQLKGGYSIARRYSVYEVGDRVDWGLAAFKFGDDRERLNPYFSDGAILQIRFIYRFFSN